MPLPVLADVDTFEWVDYECSSEESGDEKERAEADPIGTKLIKILPNRAQTALSSGKTAIAWISWHTRNTALHVQETPVPPPQTGV